MSSQAYCQPRQSSSGKGDVFDGSSLGPLVELPLERGHWFWLVRQDVTKKVLSKRLPQVLRHNDLTN